MSGIATITVKTGATMAPTGGSDLVFAPDGVTVQNGKHLCVPAVTSYASRPTATVKYRPPSLGPDGVFTRDNKSVVYSIPRTLASGEIVFDSIEVVRRVHPETSAANALDMNIVMSQLLTDSEASNFWSSGALE